MGCGAKPLNCRMSNEGGTSALARSKQRVRRQRPISGVIGIVLTALGGLLALASLAC